MTLATLGCRLNQAETESLAARLAGLGYQVVDSVAEADLCLLNTCTVTHVADRKARHWLRWAHRLNPSALLVAVGCYAQRAPQELACLPGVALVLGNEAKERLPERLAAFFGPGESPSPPRTRTRALVKVQDGCHDGCTYCIVPQVRGRPRSRLLDEVIAEVRAKVAGGYQEVVLTGAQLGAYGRDLTSPSGNRSDLAALVRQILGETAVPRLRLSSLQPRDLSPALLALFENPRLCRHLHLPLQSGSDAILHRMGRRYSSEEYEKVVKEVQQAYPDLALTTDVLVGFPGESPEDFTATYQLCHQLDLARIHLFPYSRRPGTPAASFPHQVSEATKRQRVDQMTELARRSAQRFRERFLGRTLSVLWEEAAPSSQGKVWVGLTGNYLRVVATGEALGNQLVPATLVGAEDDSLRGVIGTES